MFFCGNEANEEKEKKKDEKKRRRISLVSTHGFKDSVIDTADKFGGDFANTVKNRIIFEDLLAAKARYHLQCYLNFLRSRKSGNVGRSIDHRIELAMEEIFSYIEENNDCQFTLKELADACTEYIPNELTIKTKLKERYEERILISIKSASLTIVCFIDMIYDVNLRAWYEKKIRNEQAERLKIIKSVAAIIREDIRSLIKDNSEYPPTNEMFNNLDTDVPSGLRL